MKYYNRTLFLISCLLALTGVNLLIFCVAAQELYPKIGYLIYQSHSPASYDADDYQMNLAWLYVLAVGCILVGWIMAARFYRKGVDDERAVHPDLGKGSA